MYVYLLRKLDWNRQSVAEFVNMTACKMRVTKESQLHANLGLTYTELVNTRNHGLWWRHIQLIPKNIVCSKVLDLLKRERKSWLDIGFIYCYYCLMSSSFKLVFSLFLPHIIQSLFNQSFWNFRSMLLILQLENNILCFSQFNFQRILLRERMGKNDHFHWNSCKTRKLKLHFWLKSLILCILLPSS